MIRMLSGDAVAALIPMRVRGDVGRIHSGAVNAIGQVRKRDLTRARICGALSAVLDQIYADR